MKVRVILLISIMLTLPLDGWGWRKEKGIIVLEKGDSLWKVAHSLYGGGWNYPLLWNRRLDSVSTNPSLVYPGMRFRPMETTGEANQPEQKPQSLDRAIAVGLDIATTVKQISKDVDTIKILGGQINNGVNPAFVSSAFSDTIPSLLTEIIVALAAALSARYGLHKWLKKKGWAK